MNKYQLYSEHCNIEIYGKDPIDAVNRQKSFPCPRHREGEKLYGEKLIANMVETEPLKVKQALEIEDTSNHRRGSDVFYRVVSELENGQIVAIDMKEVKIGRPSVGSEMLPALALPASLKAAMEVKAKEAGVSMPDFRRVAYSLILDS